MGQGHFPAVHIWATVRLTYIPGGMWDSPAVSPGLQGTGTAGGGGPHPSSHSLPAAPQRCEGRSAPMPLLMGGDENNSSHQICIGPFGAAAMVPQLPGEGWSRQGVGPEHGTGRAPGQPHAVQGSWLPQVSAVGAPAGWHLPGAHSAAVALLGRDLCVRRWILSECCC